MSAKPALPFVACAVLAASAFVFSGAQVAPSAPLIAEAPPPAQPDAPLPALDPVQERLVQYLSRRFRVAAESTEVVVSAAYSSAQHVGLDPLLVLAVIAVESRFDALAESPYGAKGLMQIIPRYHRDKLEPRGGEEAILDPETNIMVGSLILKEYVRRTGNLEAGLQYYVGSVADTSSQYAQKVMAERERLHSITRPKSSPKGV